jgi:hypothetical protein
MNSKTPGDYFIKIADYTTYNNMEVPDIYHPVSTEALVPSRATRTVNLLTA